MKAGKYSMRDLFVNNYIDQIIVPEIQRDYVWGEEQVIGLMDNIHEDYMNYESSSLLLQTDDVEIRKLFESFYKKQKYSSNIGFLYAYNDPAYEGKYFLIDGQQRTTTIYLLLLALCVKKDKAVFEKYYFKNEVLKVDYKVRDAAHTFMHEFIKYILSGSDHAIDSIKKQYWYFATNNIDPTIHSIIHNYNYISTYLEKKELYSESFLYYVQHLIEFWYFDTNLSDQGEEMYIYMNARGEQIQTNENLKAELLGRLKEVDLIEVQQRDDFHESNDIDGLKNYWGKKWEDWQDFFWQRKGNSNENADIGFNEFIQCTAGLELYKRKLETPDYSQAKVAELLDLKLIERYINALIFLEKESVLFTRKYNYAAWVGKYIELIWNYLNKYTKRNANWFSDFRDNNKNDDRNNMILLWSFFYYYESNFEVISSDEFFRVMRFFYVRYHNYNRSVSTLVNTIKLISINGIIDSLDNELGEPNENSDDETNYKLRTYEEKLMYTFLSGKITEPEILKQYESILWKLEDQEYNLDGSYLKNMNISHLVDFNSNPSLVELHSICDRFYQLMSFTENYEEEKLLTLLLHYGEFWQRVSPWYYFNFKFNDWRRIIRGADGNGIAFRNFFTEYLSYENVEPLSELINRKNREFLVKHAHNLRAINNFREQIIVYSMLLNDIWDEGYHICYENQVAESRFFENELIIFNCERYKGSQWYFWEKAKSIHQNQETMLNYLLATLN